MGRQCSECEYWLSCSRFSRNQWLKGDGFSRCKDCVSYYKCKTCARLFDSPNELDMHMQIHRPRNVACPVCGERRFKSGANAVQHVESGYCTGCVGKNRSREEIYRYAQRRREMHKYLNDTPLLTNGYYDDDIPDYPYHCPTCQISFRQLSQLLQHLDNKHNNTRLLRN